MNFMLTVLLPEYYDSFIFSSALCFLSSYLYIVPSFVLFRVRSPIICSLTCKLSHYLSSYLCVVPSIVLIPVHCSIICPLPCALCLSSNLSSRMLRVAGSYPLFTWPVRFLACLHSEQSPCTHVCLPAYWTVCLRVCGGQFSGSHTSRYRRLVSLAARAVGRLFAGFDCPFLCVPQRVRASRSGRDTVYWAEHEQHAPLGELTNCMLPEWVDESATGF